MSRGICDSVFLVGGAQLSHPSDCLVYLVDAGDLVLIDCGAGPSWPAISDHICDAGYDPAAIHTLVLTHCHVDHIGAAAQVKQSSGCEIAAHQDDRYAIETADPVRTGADLYGISLPPVCVDRVISDARESIGFARGELLLIHTPGHTPGSLVAVLETPDGHTVLFGQDIHGPFSPLFGSDIRLWRKSMQTLLDLNADILCEGHYGVFHGPDRVRQFILGQLDSHRNSR